MNTCTRWIFLKDFSFCQGLTKARHSNYSITKVFLHLCLKISGLVSSLDTTPPPHLSGKPVSIFLYLLPFPTFQYTNYGGDCMRFVQSISFSRFKIYAPQISLKWALTFPIISYYCPKIFYLYWFISNDIKFYFPFLLFTSSHALFHPYLHANPWWNQL